MLGLFKEYIKKPVCIPRLNFMSGQFVQYITWTWQNLLSCLKRGYFALAYRADLPDTVDFVRGTIVRIVQ